MVTIKDRRDFLALRRAPKTGTASFLLAGQPAKAAGARVRVGFTVTKKLGNAVVRNRIRRRLRAAANEVFPGHGKPGYDYVLIARSAAETRSYDAILDDMKRALLRLARDTK